jgi:hypothetical protein
LDLLPQQILEIKEKSKFLEKSIPFKQEDTNIIIETSLGVNDTPDNYLYIAVIFFIRNRINRNNYN